MPTKKQLGERLRFFRESLPGNITAKAFAAKASIDPSQYGKAERGDDKFLGEEKLIELCSAWDIGHDWLYTGRGPMKQSEFLNMVEQGPNSSAPDGNVLLDPEEIELNLVAAADAVNRIREMLKAAQSAKLDSVYRSVEKGIANAKRKPRREK